MLSEVTRSLEPLLRPSSVALLGASAKTGKIGNVVLRSLARGPFKVFPVNPNESEILGLRCYPSVSAIPGDVDLAIVALPAREAVGAVRECVGKDVAVVIVTSSGFSESGEEGARLQSELSSALRGNRTRLLGPNTMGVLVPGSQVDTLFIPEDRSPRPSAGEVAVLSQSGAVAVSFLEKARKFGMGIYACIGLGNKLDISESELLRLFAEDPEAKCIALYLESFKDGKDFIDAARAVTPQKPIVMLKSGRTPTGSRAARSHTGAIASSSDPVIDGVLRQSGVIRAYDEEELVDISRALAHLDHVDGNRVCVVASAGGFGVMAADLIESSEHGAGLSMATLSEATIRRLRGFVPAYSSVLNPVDLTAEVDDSMYDAVLEVLQRDRGIDIILMSLELQPPRVTKALVEVAIRRSRDASVPIVVCAFGTDTAPDVVGELEANRVPVYPTIRRGVKAVNALCQRGTYLRRMKR